MRKTYVYKQQKVGKYIVKVVQDDNPIDPREEWDNLCTMVCFHRNYRLGDKHNHTPETIADMLKWNRKTIFYRPLYLYDHSGITISTAPFSCRWDSGQVGWIYVERDKFLKEFGFKKMTKKAKERLEELFVGETKVYDDYLTGNVYGFVVEEPESEACVSSCWGFFGEPEDCLAEGVSEARAIIKHDIKKHLNLLKIWIKNRVPLEKRTPLSV